MSDIEFYKATSSGDLEDVENSTNSLHYRRSILIKDHITQTVWLIHGSGVSDKTHDSAETNASRIVSEYGGSYDIERVDPDDAVDVIDEIFANKENKGDVVEDKPQPKVPTTSKPAMDKLPSVPKVKSSNVDFPEPVAEEEVDGPEIKQFQIAYFVEDEEEEEVITSDTELIKQVLQQVSSYIREIDDIIENRPDRSDARSVLNKLSDDIITLIYERD